MNACPYCGAAGDMGCRSTCDGGYDGYADDWRDKYASYLISCGPMDAEEAHRLAEEAFGSSGDEDPEETASSDLACMREDGA